jgi:NAD+ synthase (glutamine-hydrolysing)
MATEAPVRAPEPATAPLPSWLEGARRVLRVVLAQIDVTVGDLRGNAERVLAEIEAATALGADLVVFPELAVTGYPPEDLLLKPHFTRAAWRETERIANEVQNAVVLLGTVVQNDDLYNAAAVLYDGEVHATYCKHYLPNYAVFDEQRYFQSGTRPLVLDLGGARVGVTICEDIWYPGGPAQEEALAGADLIVTLSASPYHWGKGRERERMIATRAADYVTYVAFCNLVGGQDELVFDGHSLVFDPEGGLVARGKQFAEDRIVVDLDLGAVFSRRLRDPRRREMRPRNPDGVETVVLEPGPGPHVRAPLAASPVPEPLPRLEELYAALVLGTRDYVRKNGFEKVVLGLSGGIDSALTAAIATDALGPENVVGVSMPSRYTSRESLEDAEEVARRLGIRLLTIPIDRTFQCALETLAPAFEGRPADVTEENLQARIRGVVLMSLSNKFGWLVLTTGNKSEVSVGYYTLYGDSAGGFAVLKDVRKSLVYELARHRNATRGPAIPERVLTKPPSAELRPGQRDTDTLPPYEHLDPVLEAYVEDDRSPQEIVQMGFDPDLVRRVVSMVDRAEFKRRQSPPGIRVTHRGFGKDWRVPITNRYREPDAQGG